jgi:hypothetical protein
LLNREYKDEWSVATTVDNYSKCPLYKYQFFLSNCIFVRMISPTENKNYIAENMTAQFNPDKQHTITSEASISGTGLHTGVLVDLTLKPATPGFGIQFQRIDLPVNQS